MAKANAKASGNGCYNVYRFISETDDSKMDFVGSALTEAAAIDIAYRLGGDQIQQGIDGRVRNVDRRNWFQRN